MKKLNNSIIDYRLINRNIKRLDDYINAKTKISFKCLKHECNYSWTTTANHIISGKTGCPKCAKVMRLTNEIIDERLFKKNIIRIGNCVGADNNIDFKCLICNFIWLAKPTGISKAHGCPKCANNIRLSNEIIDLRIINKNIPIKRIGNYVNLIYNIDFQCNKCDHIWSSRPANIIHNNRGCPKCNASGKNEKIIYNLLKNNNIDFDYHYRVNYNNKNYIVDFYIKSINLIVEYNGDQHYKPIRFNGISSQNADSNFIRQQNRDAYIKQFCEENDINIIWIDGRKYKDDKLKLYIETDILPLIMKDNK